MEKKSEKKSTIFTSQSIYKDGGKTVEECQDMIQRSFRSPTVKFLREHLEKSGCRVGDRFIKAVECDKKISGGYVRGEGPKGAINESNDTASGVSGTLGLSHQEKDENIRHMLGRLDNKNLVPILKSTEILVCSNHLNLQDEVDQVVIHELIHAYDDCRAANLDWTNCAHHACSEIRAGHLSGDCHYKREFLRGYMKIRGHEPECVRRRVLKSVLANPYCSESAAKDAMDAVWDVCYNDTKPFDRAP